MAVQEACLDASPILLFLEGTHFFVRLTPFETTLQETPSRMLVPRERSLNLLDHRFSVQAFQHISKSALQLLFARSRSQAEGRFAVSHSAKCLKAACTAVEPYFPRAVDGQLSARGQW